MTIGIIRQNVLQAKLFRPGDRAVRPEDIMLRWGLLPMDFTRLSRTPPDAMRRGTSSLKLRILGGIFVVFFLSLGMVLYVTWTYQRDRFVEQTSRHALQTGLLIEAGLRTSMLLNDREATM